MQKVKIYTTAWCPYCVQAMQFLKERGVEQIEEICVDEIPGARAEMMSSTRRRSVPQIFVGQTHVGGCDDLMALHRSGGLLPLLQAP